MAVELLLLDNRLPLKLEQSLLNSCSEVFKVSEFTRTVREHVCMFFGEVVDRIADPFFKAQKIISEEHHVSILRDNIFELCFEILAGLDRLPHYLPITLEFLGQVEKLLLHSLHFNLLNSLLLLHVESSLAEDFHKMLDRQLAVVLFNIWDV